MKKVFYLAAMAGMLSISAANAQVTRVVDLSRVFVNFFYNYPFHAFGQ